VENSVEIVDNRLYNSQKGKKNGRTVSDAGFAEKPQAFSDFCQYTKAFSQRALAFLIKEFYNKYDQQNLFPQGG